MTDSTAVINDSVRVLPPKHTVSSPLVLYFAQSHDIIEPWQGNTLLRDEQLAAFWKSEPFLESAVTSLAMTRAALSWELSGPPKTIAKVQQLLNSANFGQGWQHLMMQVNIDLLTSDAGAFIEVIREKPPRGKKAESMPVIGLAHLPAIQCLRTGDPMQPVIYIDRNNTKHYLKWYQVITLAENPIPESETGRQLCFISRVLGFAQMIKDIEQHHGEKLSGRFSKAIHVISGVAQGEIEQIQQIGEIDANNRGLYRYGQPLILTTLDPNARVTKETIELASMPDGFDLDKMLSWYITLLALASGSDYQEFAPLSNGNLGTASQSDTLHRKAQRKGTQLFIKLIETALHQFKVIPSSVTFRFKQQDAQAELEQADIEKVRAETRKLQIESGEITPEIARQIAVDKSDLKQEYLMMLGEVDTTPNVSVSDDEVVSQELIDNETAHGKALHPLVATRTALWWLKQIINHPLQTVTPIPDVQLWQFAAALKDTLHTGVSATTVGWMTPDLVQAAQLAGISPIALRHRLPDEQTVYLTPNSSFTGKRLIADVPVIKAAPYNPLQTLVTTFTRAYPTSTDKNALVRDTTLQAYRLARGNAITDTDFEKVKAQVQHQITLLNVTNRVELLTLGLYNTYNMFS